MIRDINASDLLDRLDELYDILNEADHYADEHDRPFTLEDYDDIRKLFRTILDCRCYVRNHYFD